MVDKVLMVIIIGVQFLLTVWNGILILLL